MTKTVVWLASIGALGLAASCASDDTGATSELDCSPSYEEVAIFDKCTMCHSSELATSAERHNAPSNINFDTESAAEQAARDAAGEVKGGEMPPRDSGVTVTDTEKTALYQWAACATK